MTFEGLQDIYGTFVWIYCGVIVLNVIIYLIRVNFTSYKGWF